MSAVAFGVDWVCENPKRFPGRLGMVTNDAARLAGDQRVTSRAALKQAGVNIVRLFSPEHGLQVKAADGAAVGNTEDYLTNLPVVSLYGTRMRPREKDLADLDGMLFDLPDIGSRFYTYIWTLHETMAACVSCGKKLFVLDRPNPVGGREAWVEGPMLDTTACASFLGSESLPIRHALTVGELAVAWKHERYANLELEVIPCHGWTRNMQWPDLGLQFVPTSPAMPSFQSALLYPGMCLFEATNLSVGRGTDWPFQLAGSPWLRSAAVVDAFTALDLPGLIAQPQPFCPEEGAWKDSACAGVRLVVEDRQAVRPVLSGICLLALILKLHGEFAWAHYPTAANPSGKDHLEKLLGFAGAREGLERTGPEEIRSTAKVWCKAPGWWDRVAPFRLYGDAD